MSDSEAKDFGAEVARLRELLLPSATNFMTSLTGRLSKEAKKAACEHPGSFCEFIRNTIIIIFGLREGDTHHLSAPKGMEEDVLTIVIEECQSYATNALAEIKINGITPWPYIGLTIARVASRKTRRSLRIIEASLEGEEPPPDSSAVPL